MIEALGDNYSRGLAFFWLYKNLTYLSTIVTILTLNPSVLSISILIPLRLQATFSESSRGQISSTPSYPSAVIVVVLTPELNLIDVLGSIVLYIPTSKHSRLIKDDFWYSTNNS